MIGMSMDPKEVQHLASSLGCQIGSLSLRYLRLQLLGRRKDIKSWNRVLELVTCRLEGWKSRFFLMGGRLVIFHQF